MPVMATTIETIAAWAGVGTAFGTLALAGVTVKLASATNRALDADRETLKVGQLQAATAQEALDAQTQPFLTADEDQNPEDLAGRNFDPRSLREGGGATRWRLRVVNAGHGTAVITHAAFDDSGMEPFVGGQPQVGQTVLRPGDVTHLSIAAGGGIRPEGPYHFNLEYRDVALERVRGAVRIEMTKQHPGNKGWVQRIAWAETFAELDTPKFEQHLEQPYW